MPKEKIRDIDEIMDDMTLTEEEWRQEMTESYKSQYMKQPHIVKMEKELKEIRENIAAAAQGEKPDPKLLRDLAEELEKTSEKMAKEEKKIDETVEGLIRGDREKRTEFAKKPIVVSAEDLKEIEDALGDEAPDKEKGQMEAAKAEPKKEEPKKKEPKKEEPEKSIDQLREENEKISDALRDDLDMPQEEWMQKMHKAIEQDYLLQNYEKFAEQDKKTKDLTDAFNKLQKEGGDKKKLEDAKKDLGDHLAEVTKDRSKVAAQVENMYENELSKRREALENKQGKLKKEGKADTSEGKKLAKSIDLSKKEEQKTADLIPLLEKESQDPPANIFESIFQKVFSNWLPNLLYSAAGMIFGHGQAVRTEQVPLENYGLPSFLKAGEFTLPGGADHTTDLFKAVEEKKEKTSEEILKVDRAAELNFDRIDEAAKKHGDQLEEAHQRMAPKGDPGLKMSDLKGVPHKDVEVPEKEAEKAPAEEAAKGSQKENKEPKKPAKLQAAGNNIVKASELKRNVPHAEVTEKQEEIVQEQPVHEVKPDRKEEVKPEEPKQAAPAPEAEEPNNVLKAFKLLDLYQSMKGHDSKTHINSDKYNTMMKSMENLQGIMGDGFGDAFGTLMRDFGNIKSFQDLCKKGGPLDLAVGQALGEVEKKCDAYVQEKTNHLTKTHMGSGLGNARLKDAMDGLSILNPERAKELGEKISIDVLDGKSSKRMNYNELNQKEHEQEEKEMDAKKKERLQIVGDKKKERELLDRDPVMSKEEKSKQQGMRLK